MHVQTFRKRQDPFPEHADGFVELIPKHCVNSHRFPEYPELQVQLFNETQDPLPEQTFEFVELIP
jgi:hypothetical protein